MPYVRSTTRIRKPYTITKSREIWTEPEHDKFLEALHLDLTSSPPSTSSTSSSGRPHTLEALIKADARKLKSFRILEEEELRMLSGTKLKASNIIMQLISRGSVSVKDPSFGMIPTYKPRFSLENIAIREALRNLICTSCGGPLFLRTHTSTTKNCELKMLI